MTSILPCSAFLCLFCLHQYHLFLSPTLFFSIFFSLLAEDPWATLRPLDPKLYSLEPCYEKRLPSQMYLGHAEFNRLLYFRASWQLCYVNVHPESPRISATPKCMSIELSFHVGPWECTLRSPNTESISDWGPQLFPLHRGHLLWGHFQPVMEHDRDTKSGSTPGRQGPPLMASFGLRTPGQLS